MKGTILDYSVENDLGYISGDDGKGYQFSSSDWMDRESLPKKNLRVDFEVEGNKATEIFALPQTTSNSATSNVYDDFVELKDKIFAELKNNDNLKNIYSKITFFWSSTIYPAIKYCEQKIIYYFDRLADIPSSKRSNRAIVNNGEFDLGYNMIECKGCGRVLSKLARKCPDCGVVLKQDDIGGLFGIIAFFSGVLCFFIPLINIPLILIISFIFSSLALYKKAFIIGLISLVIDCVIFLGYIGYIEQMN